MKPIAVACFLLLALTLPMSACELCAMYSLNNPHGESGSGFSFTIAEQYVSAHTLQAEGNAFSTVSFLSQAFLDSSYTHLVPAYDFSPRFGLSLNAPIIYRDFRRSEIPTMGGAVQQTGTVSGLGDLSLIGRATLFQKNMMRYSVKVDLLTGMKFPTGDTRLLDDEIDSAKIDQALFGRNHQHGSIGGVHQHDLSLGSGSYDGVFGVASSFRWKRWFLNNQTQYYLRTEGHSYKFGDSIMVSGGPGAYVLLAEKCTLSVQANAFYETIARDEILGQTFNQTGMTAWYLGPLINLTLGAHFSASVGADLPLRIYNHGLQTVPDYRVHGVFSWRF
jgi:hypothetical protein